MTAAGRAWHKRFRVLHPSEAQVTALSMLSIALVAVAVYGRALGFGFFNDDPTGHFAWMERLSVLQIFASSAGYGFYRPLTFAVWKLLLALLGGYYAPGFHMLNVALHAANAAMLWLLAYRFSRRATYAWAAALTFTVFPLSYEAVAYVAAAFHPLAVFWTLLTLLLYRRARETRREACFVAAYLTALLGLFTHENGVLIPVLLLFWEWTSHPGLHMRELAKQPVRWFLLLPVLFAGIWLSIPKTGASNLQQPLNVLRNALAFLQLWALPMFPVLSVNAQQVWLLAGLVVTVAAAMCWVAHLARARRLYLFAALWLLAGSLPAMLLLSPAYVYGSPRLYYFASAGAALFWGLPVLALEELIGGPWGRRSALRLAQVAVAVGIVVPSLSFIHCQLDFFALATGIVRQMAALASDVPGDRQVVFVNVPFYFSSSACHPLGCRNPYPIAPTGAVVIPPYAAARDFVRVNGGPDRPIRAATFKGYNPGWNTHGNPIDLGELRSTVGTSQVYVFDLVQWAWFDLSAAWQCESAATPSQLATFDNLMALESVQVADEGERIVVTLSWRALQSGTRPLTVFVHLYDASGTLVAQHDGPPAQGFVPTPFWRAGDRIRDVHVVSLTKPLAGGAYRVAIGVYDPLTGARLAALSANGSTLADNVYLAGQLDRH